MTRFRFVLIVLAACIALGCVAPVGHIGGSSKGPDSLVAVPSRVAYEVRDYFLRTEDLKVLVSKNEAFQLVPTDKVELYIMLDPEWSDDKVLIEDDIFQLTEYGRKVIVVEYNNMSACYSIEVTDPFNMGGGGGGGSETGPGINVQWWDKPVLVSPR